MLVTTTTHMGTLPSEVTGPVFLEADGGVEPGLRRALAAEGRATLLGRRVRADKLEGVAPERVSELARQADLVLVEADGARGRSLKVPAEHEPVVPAATTLLIVVAALDVLGRRAGRGARAPPRPRAPGDRRRPVPWDRTWWRRASCIRPGIPRAGRPARGWPPS